MKDWRGHEYDVGTLIIYPRASGKSVEMAEAVVTQIYEVVWERADGWRGYGWQRVEPGASYPEEAQRAYRVRVKPTRQGSRFHRSETRWDATQGKFVPSGIAEVTITSTENITVAAVTSQSTEHHPEWKACWNADQ